MKRRLSCFWVRCRKVVLFMGILMVFSGCSTTIVFKKSDLLDTTKNISIELQSDVITQTTSTRMKTPNSEVAAVGEILDTTSQTLGKSTVNVHGTQIAPLDEWMTGHYVPCEKIFLTVKPELVENATGTEEVSETKFTGEQHLQLPKKSETLILSIHNHRKHSETNS